MTLHVDATIRQLHQSRQKAIATVYIDMAEQHARDRPSVEFLARYDVELPNITAVMDSFLLSDDEFVPQLIYLYLNFSPYMQMRGLWGILQQWGLALLDYIDQYEVVDQSGLLNNIGVSYFRHDDQATALDFYQRSIAARSDDPDHPANAFTYSNMGICYWELGELDQAHTYMFKALEMEKQLGDQDMIAQSLMNIAGVYHVKSDIEQAVHYGREAIAIVRETKNEYMLSQFVGNLALHLSAAFEVEEAIPVFEEALQLHRRIGDEVASARTTYTFGMLKSLLGEFEYAAELLSEAVMLMQRYDMVQLESARDWLGKTVSSLEQATGPTPPEAPH